MSTNSGPQNIADLFGQIKTTKPPAYQWQDLALRIIQELAIPNFKRNSVFKICKDLPKVDVEKALNDTKELCKSGLRWKYFFKVVDSIVKNKKTSD